MKKLVIVIILLAGCFSCQTLEEVIVPVLPDNDVIVFFERSLPEFSGTSISECFFVDDKEDKCVVINNADELREHISCSSAILPDIDFKSYTLIIGQHKVRSHGCSVDTQNIVVDAREATLNISVKSSEYSFAGICPLYYWGIYSKIQAKKISINVNYK